nr:MAG: hypothetical protein [Sanya fiers-like virus 32]
MLSSKSKPISLVTSSVPLWCVLVSPRAWAHVLKELRSCPLPSPISKWKSS